MIVRVATHAMATRFEIALAGDDPHRLRAIGEAGLDEIRIREQRLNLFDRGSFISHINANAASRAIELDEEMFGLLSACAAVHAASGGAFDITVAPLMRRWGFHDSASTAPASGHHIGMHLIDLDERNRTIRFRRPGIALDLGGIGKGHALDAAAEVLREEGVECALLHGGTSTSIAIGAPPGPDGWRIEIRTEGESPVVSLRDAALSVSAPHGRTIEGDGRTLGHVVDPRTGEPAESLTLAAVIARSARTADAWSTALLASGGRPAGMPDEIASVLARHDGDRIAWDAAGPEPYPFQIPETRSRPTEAIA
jgi:thiamine biosynthesis lipoprotein